MMYERLDIGDLARQVRHRNLLLIVCQLQVQDHPHVQRQRLEVRFLQKQVQKILMMIRLLLEF